MINTSIVFTENKTPHMMFIRAVTSALFLPLNTLLIISGLQAFLTLAVPLTINTSSSTLLPQKSLFIIWTDAFTGYCGKRYPALNESASLNAGFIHLNNSKSLLFLLLLLSFFAVFLPVYPEALWVSSGWNVLAVPHCCDRYNNLSFPHQWFCIYFALFACALF